MQVLIVKLLKGDEKSNVLSEGAWLAKNSELDLARRKWAHCRKREFHVHQLSGMLELISQDPSM